MRWPWGSRRTPTQAKETARLLLNLCQASIIGMVGVIFFLSDINLGEKIKVVFTGTIVSMSLFSFAMKLLREVINRE